MFGQVMRDEEIAKLFLEELLGVTIDHIEYAEWQKDLSDNYVSHGVRMDVFLRDTLGTIYNVEMQACRGELERRARYYQSAIDRNALSKAKGYEELSDSYIIFVCDYDHFGVGLAVYERLSVVKGTDKSYEDGSHVLVLNSQYKNGNAKLPILEYLDYVRTNDEESGKNLRSLLLERTMEKVEAVRNNKGMEVPYMTFEMKIEEERRRAHAEGLEQGLRKAVYVLKKHLSAEEIAKELEIPVEQVKKLWD